jgi:hypothetical protein
LARASAASRAVNFKLRHYCIPGPADLGLRVLFLSSKAAQPQGGEILSKIRDMVKELIEQDEPVIGEIHFCQDHHVWAMQRQAVLAYA